MRRRSRKAQRLAPLRRAFVQRILEERVWCEARWDAGCFGRAVDVHEPLTRARGGSILDPANAMAVCRRCHEQIHGHPREATERGFLISRYGEVA